jgi:hypothetical protein|uniref:Uncharacterized protein n=1 Tax=Zea mays TaxID=4577 RepID=C4J454_MAIZE|nr:unknown [Zea mays]
MLFGLKREGHNTGLKSRILTVAPHRLQSNNGDLMLHPESPTGNLPFPLSFLADAENEFLLCSTKWGYNRSSGPTEGKFLAECVEFSSQS